MDNIKTWTGLTVEESARMAEDRGKWRKHVHGAANPRIEEQDRIVDSTNQTSSDLYAGYYACVFLSYLYICMNPFIYAAKHEGVKEKLAGLMIWRGRVTVAPRGNSKVRNITGGTQHSHAVNCTDQVLQPAGTHTHCAPIE